MTLIEFVARNVRRNSLRLSITVAAVAISLIAYLLLRTVSSGWTRRVDETPEDRVVSRNSVSWEQTMPMNYAGLVASMPGIKQAMGGRAVVLRYPRMEQVGFQTTAVQAEPFIRMHHELVAPPAQKQAFIANRQGALVSTVLAAEFGWKLGDRVRLKGSILSKECELTIDGLYESTRHGFARRAVWMHLEYLNELVELADREQINVISAQIADKSQGAEQAMAVDRFFEQRDVQTFSQEDQASNAAVVGMFGAILDSLNTVGILILAIILLIVGNTMSMTTRERSHEFGVLRAIGFSSAHAVGFILGEAAIIGFLGGAVGVLLAYPLLQAVVSRYFEQAIQIPPLEVPIGAAAAALLLGGLLGVLSAAAPAYGVAKLKIVEALRRV